MATKSKKTTTRSKKLGRAKKVNEVKPLTGLSYGSMQWTYTQQKPS
jgi:hypothetical protein